MVKARIIDIKKHGKEDCVIVATDLDSVSTHEEGPVYELQLPGWRVERLACCAGCSDFGELKGKTLLIEMDSMLVAFFHAEDVDKISIAHRRKHSER